MSKLRELLQTCDTEESEEMIDHLTPKFRNKNEKLLIKIKNYTLYKSMKYWKDDLKYWEVRILWQKAFMK